MATEINIKKMDFNDTDDENSEDFFSSEQDENSQVNEEFGFRSQSFTSLTRLKIYTEFLQLAGALMEHFLRRIAPLRHRFINPNEKSIKYRSSLLS